MITQKRQIALNYRGKPHNHEERLHDALFRVMERWWQSAGTRDRGAIVLTHAERVYLQELLYPGIKNGAVPYPWK